MNLETSELNQDNAKLYWESLAKKGWKNLTPQEKKYMAILSCEVNMEEVTQ